MAPHGRGRNAVAKTELHVRMTWGHYSEGTFKGGAEIRKTPHDLRLGGVPANTAFDNPDALLGGDLWSPRKMYVCSRAPKTVL